MSQAAPAIARAKSIAGQSAGGRKRGRSRSPSRERGQEGCLNEENIGLAAQLEKGELLDQEKAFWSQFDTALVATWLADYNQHGLALAKFGDREVVINHLALLITTGAGATRPKAKKLPLILKALQKHHQQKNPDFAGTPPGLYVAAAASPPADNAAMEVEEEGDQPSSSDDESIPGAMEVDGSPVPPPVLVSPSPAKSPGSVATSKSAKSPRTPRQVAPPGHGPPTYSGCPACLAPPPLGAGSPFVCEACGRRSDLHATDPINAELRRDFVEDRAYRAQRSTVPIPERDAGQKGDMPRASPSGSSNDRQCALQLLSGHDSPLFSGVGAALPVKHDVALLQIRKALHGMTYDLPSEPLQQLIRAGKLTQVGWAVPRKPQSFADDAPSTLSVVNGELVSSSSKGRIPKSCANLQQFAAAMFGTILPALIDKPAAMMQWITLGRTALELEREYDWNAASAYIDQLLQERVPLGLPYDAVSSDALTSINQLRAASVVAAASGAHRPHHPSGSSPSQTQQPRHQQSSMHEQLCLNFQWGKCATPCDKGRRHVCRQCGATTHGGDACKARGGRRPPRDQMPPLEPPAGGGQKPPAGQK